MVQQRKKTPSEKVLRGIGVSPGVVIGPVFRVTREEDSFAERERTITPGEVEAEIVRFEKAVIQTRGQIREIQDSLGEAVGRSHANIFDVHLMVLDDRAFVEEVIRQIRQSLKNAEAAVGAVVSSYTQTLSKLEDGYLRERVADVKDVARRILHSLSGRQASLLEYMTARSIVVANDLAPSETAVLRKDLVMGFATDAGSLVSHTAIMARALKIPAVVGLGHITDSVESGDQVLIDGNKGLIVVHPRPESLAEYDRLMEARKSLETGLSSLRDLPAETRDGRCIILSANIEMLSEVEEVRNNGAEGVGLFRSEYLYLSRQDLPTEDEQAEAYGEVAARLAPAPVIIRTIDLGGDKFAPYLTFPYEVNPFMGLRAIRFCLAQPELFKVQLRAILRASRHGNVKLTYPMVSNVNEVIKANAILNEVKEDLRSRHVAFDENIEVGVMIEIPSAALTADIIAEHVKFFSLGTNDLIQYTMAVDRVNERVAHLYEPTHPAILKLVDNVIRAGHERGLWVGVCGEVAGDPVLAPLLLGLGVDELSMAPSAVPMVKAAIRSVTLTQARKLAEAGKAASSGVDVLRYCRELMQNVAPEILELRG